MAKTKRVQVLMEPGEFDLLEALARKQRSSVSDLMREAARAHWLARATTAQRASAARAFLGLADTPLPEWDELEREIEARRG